MAPIEIPPPLPAETWPGVYVESHRVAGLAVFAVPTRVRARRRPPTRA
jgi:hypothetical protein